MDLPSRTLEILVPQRYDAPGDDRYRLRAEVVGVRTDRPPVVFLTGGPGESGIRALAFDPFRRVVEALAQDREVVLLDQRGIGTSQPSLRIALIEMVEDFFIDPNRAFLALREQAARTLEEGFDPHSISPWQSAQDLGPVADALGAEVLDVLGYSYGTHLTMAALRLIPERVRRVILCGFEGPDQTLKLPSEFTAQLLRLSHTSGEDLAGLLEEALARLLNEPLAGVGPFGLKWILASWFGLSNRTSRIPGLLRSILSGSPDEMATAAAGFLKMLNSRSPAYYLCDSASGVGPERLAQIHAEARHSLIGDTLNFPFPMIREAWHQTDLGDPFRGPLHVTAPTLIRLGEMDGFTPPTNVAPSGVTFADVRVSVLPGAAHNDLLSDEGAAESCRAFFDVCL